MDTGKVAPKTAEKASSLDLSIRPRPAAIAQAATDDAKNVRVVVVTGM